MPRTKAPGAGRLVLMPTPNHKTAHQADRDLSIQRLMETQVLVTQCSENLSGAISLLIEQVVAHINKAPQVIETGGAQCYEIFQESRSPLYTKTPETRRETICDIIERFDSEVPS